MNNKQAKKLRKGAKLIGAAKGEVEQKKIYKRLKEVHKQVKNEGAK